MANKKTLTPTSLPASLTLPEERKAEKALLFGLLASRKSHHKRLKDHKSSPPTRISPWR